MTAGEHSITILVLSCDAYSDLWRPCVTLWRRHWPDCPWPLVIGSERVELPELGVRMVRAEPGAAWSDCVRSYLAQIETPRVLVVLEDFFIREPIDATRLMKLARLAVEHDLACLRLVRRPGPDSADRWSECGQLGELRDGANYRVSTQAAIWRRDVLAQLLVPGESAWEFETRGSARASVAFPRGFYGVYRDALPYGHHVVERGQWFPWDAWLFGRMEIGCDFNRRRIMPRGQALRWLLRKTKDVVLAPLPGEWRATLRRFVQFSR